MLNPYARLILHVRRDEVSRHVSPVELQLLCGCRCEVQAVVEPAKREAPDRARDFICNN